MYVKTSYNERLTCVTDAGNGIHSASFNADLSECRRADSFNYALHFRMNLAAIKYYLPLVFLNSSSPEYNVAIVVYNLAPTCKSGKECVL
ncbi:hypothetical protein Plhal304r1_c028g0093461 [Plasmopara halstedii]